MCRTYFFAIMYADDTSLVVNGKDLNAPGLGSSTVLVLSTCT